MRRHRFTTIGLALIVLAIAASTASACPQPPGYTPVARGAHASVFARQVSSDPPARRFRTCLDSQARSVILGQEEPYGDGQRLAIRFVFTGRFVALVQQEREKAADTGRILVDVLDVRSGQRPTGLAQIAYSPREAIGEVVLGSQGHAAVIVDEGDRSRLLAQVGEEQFVVATGGRGTIGPPRLVGARLTWTVGGEPGSRDLPPVPPPELTELRGPAVRGDGDGVLDGRATVGVPILCTKRPGRICAGRAVLEDERGFQLAAIEYRARAGRKFTLAYRLNTRGRVFFAGEPEVDLLLMIQANPGGSYARRNVTLLRRGGSPAPSASG